VQPSAATEIELVKLSAPAGATFSLFFPPCQTSCQLQLRAQEQGRAIPALNVLPESLALNITQQMTFAKTVLLNPVQVHRFIATDVDGETLNSIELKAVPLDSKLSAIVVTLEYGFEHVHRRHQIFLVHQGLLKQVFEGGDIAGPTVSSLTALSPGRFVFINRTYAGQGEDFFYCEHLSFDASKGALVKQKARPLPTLVMGNFETPEAARQNTTCHEALILKQGSQYLAAAPFASSSEAAAVQKKCGGTIQSLRW
jgi:hypothetical protein